MPPKRRASEDDDHHNQDDGLVVQDKQQEEEEEEQEEDSEEQPTKRRKKKKGEGNGDEKEGVTASRKKQQTPIHKIWSERDVISLLKGIIDYRKDGHGDPFTDIPAFLDYVKKSFQFEPDRLQLNAKIRRLKGKYANNLRKAPKTGEDLVISNPFELKCYQLSKLIWGNDITKTNRKKKNVKADHIIDSDEENVVGNHRVEEDEQISFLSFCLESIPELFGCMDPNTLVDLIGTSKVNELEQKWSKLNRAEMKLYSDKLDLIQHQTKLILDAIRSS